MDLAAKILSKKPSEELLNLIKEIGNLGTRITELFETIKQKGQEEGFTYEELRDLLKTHLKGSLTRGQINWYLYEKDKMNLRKQMTISGQIDRNNLIEQASVERLKPRAERQGQLNRKKRAKK